MNWTSEKPKEAGWYWYKTQDEDGESIEIVQAHRSEANRIMYFYFVFDEVAYEENDMDGEWLGPISPDDKAQGRVAGLTLAQEKFADRFKGLTVGHPWIPFSPYILELERLKQADAQAAQDEKGVGEL